MVTGSQMRTRTIGKSGQGTLMPGEALGSFLGVSKLLLSTVSVQKDVMVLTALLSCPGCCWGWISTDFTGSWYIKKPPKYTNE